MTYLDHTHTTFSVFGNDPQSLSIDDTFRHVAGIMSSRVVAVDFGVEQFLGVIRFEPFDEGIEFLGTGFGSWEGDYKMGSAQSNSNNRKKLP